MDEVHLIERRPSTVHGARKAMHLKLSLGIPRPKDTEVTTSLTENRRKKLAVANLEQFDGRDHFIALRDITRVWRVVRHIARGSTDHEHGNLFTGLQVLIAERANLLGTRPLLKARLLFRVFFRLASVPFLITDDHL